MSKSDLYVVLMNGFRKCRQVRCGIGIHGFWRNGGGK